MAVFPDRIVLKNSTDGDSSIKTAISPGGSDAVHPGELVIGRENGAVKLYSLDAQNTIVTVAGGSSSGSGSSVFNDLLDVNVGRTWFSGFETGDALPVLGTDTISTEQSYEGTKSLKSSSANPPSTFEGVFSDTAARYDAWCFRFRANTTPSATYHIPLGGTQKPGTQADPINGYSLYISGTNCVFSGYNSTHVLSSSIPAFSNNTWYHLGVQLDWGSTANRAAPPRVSVWINGTIVVNNVLATATYQTNSSIDLVFNTADGSNYTKYFDNFHIGQKLSSSIVSMTSNVPAATFEAAIKALGPTKGSSVVFNGGEWVPGSFSSSINDLTDVDTSTTPPTADQALAWDGTNWVPVTVSADYLSDVDTTTVPPVEGQVLSWDGTNWVPDDQSGGGIAGTIIRKTDIQTASGGVATFSGIGASGLLVSIASSLDAWIVLYPTAADRTADAGRAYGDDPTPGSGVLSEVYVQGGTTVLASPGTAYYNNDTTVANAIYAAVRNQSGNNVNAEVTITAYAHQSFAGTGTNRVSDTGVASGGNLTLTGLGQTGQLCTVTSSLAAWIVVYGSAADRTNDATRPFNQDPLQGSGVMAEFYVSAGSTVLASPGTTYFNNDTTPKEAVYLAVRDQTGLAVDSQVTITAYAETSYTSISGGTFGSG